MTARLRRAGQRRIQRQQHQQIEGQPLRGLAGHGHPFAVLLAIWEDRSAAARAKGRVAKNRAGVVERVMGIKARGESRIL